MRVIVTDIILPRGSTATSWPGSCERSTSEKAPDPDLTGIHVLVLDDNEDARVILHGYLSYLGALVTTTASAEEALKYLENIQADVIVSDLSMPGLDGHNFRRAGTA